MPDMEKTVLSLYYHEELTLREISKIVHLHESRISQLKSQAILRLRSYMEKRWPMAARSLADERTPPDIRHWLLEQFSSQLATVFETMAGERPSIEIEPVAEMPAERRCAGGSRSPGRGRRLDRRRGDCLDAAGGHISARGGHRGHDAASLKSTYLETISQALSGVAQGDGSARRP